MESFLSHIALLLLSSILLCSLSTATEAAGQSKTPPLAMTLQPFVDRHELAGAVTLVADKDKVLSLEAVGAADVAGHKPMRTDSIFWIASQTKPMTGTAMMMLVDEGKIKLDDAVEKYLPEFKGQMLIVEQDDNHRLLKKPSRPITIRDVLSHTSGLPFASPLETPTLDALPLDVAVRSYAMLPLQSEPETKYQYSNAGINIAARILEVVSGIPYEKFMQQRLFAPLGMKDTTFWPSESQLKRVATSYKPNASNKGLEAITISQLLYPLSDRTHRYAMPAGGLFSTATDVARFCRMILNSGTLDGKRYLSEAAVQQMTTRQTRPELEGYGLGWGAGDDWFGHGGAQSTNMTIDKKRGLITVFLVQHVGFPGEGGKSHDTWRQAALNTFGPSPDTAKPAATPAGLSLHPQNPRYFLFRGRPTVLITSGEHYGAVLNADFDYVRYLDALQQSGLNHTRTWVGTYREIPGSFNITDNVLAPLPGRYLCPWARSDTLGSSDGGPKFDLARWDDAYFARLKDFMAQASKRGIVVEMNIFCPNYDESLWKANPMNAANNINGVGNHAANEVYTLRHKDLLAVQEAVTRKIVQELKAFDNLYYEVCNEPYFGGVTMEWQHHIVDVIRETEAAFPQKHLISMNIANGRAKVENPHPAVSIFNFHYCTPPDVVELNAGLNKVIGENETGFRGRDDVLYRTEGWDFILAGGALYNNLDYSFTTAHPDGTFLDYKSPGGGSPALRSQLQILKSFIEGFDFIHMAPNNGVLKGGVPKETAARVLAQPGQLYALYFHGGTQVSPQLELLPGRYALEWLNPKTGKVDKAETLQHKGGIAILQSPAYSEDVALSLKVVR